jgi:hypothetical protein
VFLVRRSLTAVAGAALVALTATVARAQQSAGGQMACCAGGMGQMSPMPESYRALQVRMLENERTLIVHMIDSMPAPYFREKATPEQRDFGQQLYHCAAALGLLARFAGAPRPAFADTANGFDKNGLKAYVNAAYDWAESFARTQPATDREAMVTFFGAQMPKWQILDELHQHTMWTLGQTVANFRMHGMAPASFMFF